MSEPLCPLCEEFLKSPAHSRHDWSFARPALMPATTLLPSRDPYPPAMSLIPARSILLSNFDFPRGRPHQLQDGLDEAAEETPGDIAIVDRPCQHHIGQRWGDTQRWVRRPRVLRQLSLFETSHLKGE